MAKQKRTIFLVRIHDHSSGDFEKAVYYHSMCLDICKQVENKAEEGRACGNLGSSYQNLGDYEKALYYHQLNLELAKETGNKREQGRANGNIGKDGVLEYWRFQESHLLS